MDNPLWDYSLSVYASPAVSAACLALQDGCGLDVNLLLYAAWLAREGRRLTPEHLAEVQSAVGEWREEVVRPLRDLRRRLRVFPPAEVLRDEIRALELRAERQQQDMLYRCYRDAAALPAADDALRDNLALLAAGTGAAREQGAALIERLATALAAPAGVASPPGG